MPSSSESSATDKWCALLYWSWYGFDSRVEWCACFVSWCYNQAGLSEPRFSGCTSGGMAWFQSRGQWANRGYSDIAPGDAIFFDWDNSGNADHVGIVIGTDGTNSAAVLVGLHKHSIPVDLILFADTGGEQPHTYQFIRTMDDWLAAHGMPQITVVEKYDRSGHRLTLEMECLRSRTLPSIAYGHKRCSQKHKIGPQEKFCNHYPPCREAWARGEKITRFLGYDAGEMRRYEHSKKFNDTDKKYINRYPLIEDWGWDRSDCVREILAAGLPLPGKSSCFFCPSMKQPEILALKEHYPDLYWRAVAMEEGHTTSYQRQGAGPQLRLAGAVRSGGGRAGAVLTPVFSQKIGKEF